MSMFPEFSDASLAVQSAEARDPSSRRVAAALLTAPLEWRGPLRDAAHAAAYARPLPGIVGLTFQEAVVAEVGAFHAGYRPARPNHAREQQ